MNKPKTMKEQVDMMWEILTNHIPTRLKWQDRKLNFIMAFVGLILAFLGILIVRG